MPKAEASEAWGLQQVVRRALEALPDFAALDQKIEIQEAEFQNSRAAFYPSLDLNSTYGFKKDTAFPKDSNLASGLSLKLTENLYDNGESWKIFSIEKLKKRKIVFENRLKREKKLLDVLNLYFDLMLSDFKKKILLELTQEVDKIFKGASQDYFQGIKSQRDYIRFKSRKLKADIDLSQETLVNQQKRQGLLTLLQTDSREGSAASVQFQSFRPSLPLLPKELNEDELLPKKVFELSRSIDEYEVSRVERNFLPQVNLVMAAGYGSSDFLSPGQTWRTGETNSWSALVQFNWNLLDFGILRRKVSIARSQAIINERNDFRELLDFEARNRSVFSELQTGIVNSSRQDELLQLEKSNYLYLANEYKRGQLSYVDYSAALESRFLAERTYLEGLFKITQNYYEILSLQGRLEDEITKK